MKNSRSLFTDDHLLLHLFALIRAANEPASEEMLRSFTERNGLRGITATKIRGLLSALVRRGVIQRSTDPNPGFIAIRQGKEAAARARLSNDNHELTVDRDLYSGLIRLHVLHHAVQEPIFGLGMIEELAKHGCRISPGSLYPLLHGLQKKGYLRSSEVRNGKSLRKLYCATPLGRKALTAVTVKVRELFRELMEGNWRVTIWRQVVLQYAFRCMAVLLVLPLPLAAQTSPTAVTLRQAVDAALRNYPSIHVSQEQINAVAAGIQLARTAYLPRIEALAQVNRATRNNVFGLLLPQTVIPPISGPVLGTNNAGSAWGTAVGMLVTWEPFDFGLREANVTAATAARKQSEAALKRTQFDIVVATADAYLTIVAAQETVRAAQAGVERSETIERTISALVKSELRPGADTSRAQAELAAARTQLIQAQQTTEMARATLSQFIGAEPAQISIVPARLLDLPPEAQVPSLDPAANPASQEQAAMIEQAQAQLRALQRSYFPRFFAQGAAFARGTGVETSGRLLRGANGLAPNVQNYALGFTVSFSVFDLPAIRAREAAQSANIRTQTARLQQIVTDLRAQWNRAVAALQGARRIAANTPLQVAAARAATQQATARYEAGLGNITEVAEAQRLLTQSEIDDALARLAVWRGLLGVAVAAGDIQPFVAEAGQ